MKQSYHRMASHAHDRVSRLAGHFMLDEINVHHVPLFCNRHFNRYILVSCVRLYLFTVLWTQLCKHVPSGCWKALYRSHGCYQTPQSTKTSNTTVMLPCLPDVRVVQWLRYRTRKQKLPGLNCLIPLSQSHLKIMPSQNYKSAKC